MKGLVPMKKDKAGRASNLGGNGFDPLLDDTFKDFFPEWANQFSPSLPAVDIGDNNQEVTLRIEVPGLSEKDIDITWHNGVLLIRGEKIDEKDVKKKDWYYRECKYGSFSREIPVGRNVDWEKAKAHCKNGVLTITMPKTEGAAGKTITVKTK